MSLDNQYVVYSSDDKILRILNLEKRIYEGSLQGHTNIIRYIKITSDSKFIVSVSDDRTGRVWNLQKQRQESVFESYCCSVTKLILTDDNTSLASGCYGDYIIIRKIHERTKEVIVQYKGSSFNALEISNDNKFIISTFHEKMRILNLQENSEKILLRNPATLLHVQLLQVIANI